MTKPRILMTRRWPDAVEAQLTQHFEVTVNRSDAPLCALDLKEAIGHFDALLPTSTDRIDADTFDVPRKQARIIANLGVGFNHIDVGEATAQGITVTNTPDVLSECTADLAMTLMLMVARRVPEGVQELRADNWRGWRPTMLIGAQVSGKTLGIVGFGRVGQELARRAHHGFGMNVIVYDNRPISPDVLHRFGAVQVDQLDDLLPMVDFVSLNCSAAPDNRFLIDARRLDLMRPDAFLINTAQGSLVDEHALTQALMFETIGGAALDVFGCDPRQRPDLAQCDNLVMLPQMGSATQEARKALGSRVLKNLMDFFDGKEPRDRVA